MEAIWFILGVIIISAITYPVLKKYIFSGDSQEQNQNVSNVLNNALKGTANITIAFLVAPFILPAFFLIMGADAEWVLTNEAIPLGFIFFWPMGLSTLIWNIRLRKGIADPIKW